MFWIKVELQDKITDIAIWFIQLVNRHKDRCLAHRLSELSKDYDPRE